jgi:tetratricopeptide (TPR) repeat protein
MEREGEDILFLQGEFARAIVSAIKVAVTPAEQALMTGTRKVSPEAYDLCMKGIELYNSFGLVERNEAKSLECFQRAVEIDPGIAMAHAWLAHMYVESAYGNQADEKEIFLKAQESVRKALEIDEHLAMAYSSRGLLNMAMNWDFAGAEQDLTKALELAPGDTWIPVFYGAVICASGRGDEAIASIKRRLETRNISGLEGLYSFRQTLHFLWSRRYDEALEEARKIPTTGQEQLFLAIVKASKGAHTEALDIVEKLKNQPVYSGDPWFRTHHAWILALAGRRKEALEALEEHVPLQTRKNTLADYDVAAVHAGLGEKDKAFEYLNKAYNEHSSRMVWLIADVYFHSLHGDPRFEELRKKVGFPDVPTAGKR